MRSTDDHGKISQSCLEDDRSVLKYPYDLFFIWSDWSILVFWLLPILGVSIERRWRFYMSQFLCVLDILKVLVALYLLHEPTQEYGAPTCPRDPGCSVSPVSLLHEPTQDQRASAYKHLSCPKAPVTLFIDPTG